MTRPPVSEEAIKLLELMLALDPKKRITAADAIMVRALQWYLPHSQIIDDSPFE